MTAFSLSDDQQFTWESDERDKHENAGDSALASQAHLHLIRGTLGDDGILGTDRGDLMLGRSGNDHFASLGGDDRLIGGSGADVLDGGAARDRIIGGAGGDFIVGNWGVDTLTGGAGRNQFVFQSAHDSGPGASSRDTVTDFDRGMDRLTFAELPINHHDGEYDFIGKHKFDAAGQVRYEAAKDGGVNVFVNMDNDDKPELSVHLKHISRLDADDFYL